MRVTSRLLTISLPLLLILSGAALADTCNDFASYTCAKSTPDIVHIGGGVSSGQSVGILLNSNTFNVTTSNGKGVGDTVVILAAFANGSPQGSVNGVSFTSSLDAFEGGSTGAIVSTMQAFGFCGSTCNLSYGYAVLGTLPAGGYVFGDFCTGEVFLLQSGVRTQLLRAHSNINSFGVDDAGEILVVTGDGSVQRISSSM